MGFGITGFIKSATQKALIRYVDPEFNERVKKATGQELTLKDFNISGDGTLMGNISAYMKESISGYLASFLGIIQEIKPDVHKADSHRYQSEITQYAVEDGTIFSQHVIQRPIKVTLQFEETNAGKMIQNIIGGSARMLSGTSKKSMFEQLVEIWERKIPVEIFTDQKIYKNMVIENLPIMHKAPYKGALQVMVDFVQLSTYQIQADEKKGITQEITESANVSKSVGKQAVADIKSNPSAEEIAGAQERFSKFDISKASQEEVSQHWKDYDTLSDAGYIVW